MNIRIALAFLLVLSPHLSAPAKDADAPALLAGAAITDISPKPGVSLDGLLQKHGPVQRVADPLEARCLVLDDGTTRLAIVTVDACVISGEIVEKAKAAAQRRTGLPRNRMLVAATHTHMAPRIAGWTDSEVDQAYYELVIRRIADAVETAVERLAPAQLAWATLDKPEFLNNRRWLMKPGTIRPNPFGEKNDRAVMGGQPAKDRLKPAGPIDPALTLISVKHADGSPLALLANYGIHYGTNLKGIASADYFGHFARQVAERSPAAAGHLPMVAMMSNGASADVNARGGDFDRMRQFAETLATDAVRASRDLDYSEAILLGMRETELELGVRKPDEKRIAWAQQILAEPPGKTGSHRWTRIFAEETQHLADFPATLPIKLQAVRIGDLALVAIPGEVFATTGLALRAETPLPLKTTMTISHANDWHGYIPPPEQHELGGMEVWPRRASYLEKQASVRIREALGDMLTSMAKKESRP